MCEAVSVVWKQLGHNGLVSLVLSKSQPVVGTCDVKHLFTCKDLKHFRNVRERAVYYFPIYLVELMTEQDFCVVEFDPSNLSVSVES